MLRVLHRIQFEETRRYTGKKLTRMWFCERINDHWFLHNETRNSTNKNVSSLVAQFSRISNLPVDDITGPLSPFPIYNILAHKPNVKNTLFLHTPFSYLFPSLSLSFLPSGCQLRLFSFQGLYALEFIKWLWWYTWTKTITKHYIKKEKKIIKMSLTYTNWVYKKELNWHHWDRPGPPPPYSDLYLPPPPITHVPLKGMVSWR